MAESTEHKTKMNRAEFADYLRALAEQFENGGEMDIAVGNKTVQLHPPDTVKSEIEVVERSSILRGNRESLELDVNWKAQK
jgi:amphi-Trp domain-containing protein